MTQLSQDSDESIFFYTFHKCASTLFSGYVLPNTEGLKHIDYAREVFAGMINKPSQITFEDKGHIYGPIRISARTGNPVRELLVVPTTAPGFVRNRRAVFFLRDPRDILVSSYYSFGFSHGHSTVPEIRTFQNSMRNLIRSQGIDGYALAHMEEQIGFFRTLEVQMSACRFGTVLRYEDMIGNFHEFSKQLSACIPLRDEILTGMYDQSRPRPVEDPMAHRRSGRVGGFQEHLRPETIESLNRGFRGILSQYGYTE